MSETTFIEPLSRVACLAAIDLELLLEEKETNLDNVSNFIAAVQDNINLYGGELSISQREITSLDPTATYAITRALTGTQSQIIKNVSAEKILNTVHEDLLNPLEKLIEDKKNNRSSPSKNIQKLSMICLKIAENYSFLENLQNDVDTHPYS